MIQVKKYQMKITQHLFHLKRYAKHFKILGEKQVHFGAFDCAATMAAQQYGQNNSTNKSGCC